MMYRAIAMCGALIWSAGAASAAETVTYSYDAKGQLVKVVHSGTVNAGEQVVYTYDKAGNRVKVVVTGAK